MTTKEYSAYIKGLIEGANLDLTTPEGKVIAALAELASKMADEIDALTEKVDNCGAYIEEIDEDLGAVEEDLYMTDDDDECYDDEEEDEFDEEDGEYYELECPSCGEIVCFDESLDPDDLVCPACGEKIADVQLCDGECDTCEDKTCE